MEHQVDIQLEVFRRSSVRDIVRFRTVNRNLSVALRSPYFINLHTSQREKHQHYLLISSVDGRSQILDGDQLIVESRVTSDIPFHPSGAAFGLVGGRNRRQGEMHCFLLCNPALRRIHSVDVPPFLWTGSVSFGVCPTSLVPKVFGFCELKEGQIEAFVYDTKLVQWSNFNTNLPAATEIQFADEFATVTDTANYWKAVVDGRLLLVSFNHTTENVAMIPIPNTLGQNLTMDEIELRNINGDLGVVVQTNDDDDHQTRVWKYEVLENNFRRVYDLQTK